MMNNNEWNEHLFQIGKQFEGDTQARTSLNFVWRKSSNYMEKTVRNTFPSKDIVDFPFNLEEASQTGSLFVKKKQRVK